MHFVVKLVDGNPATGFPGTTGLASEKIPNRRVRAGVHQTLVARFKKRRPTAPVQGTISAVVISRVTGNQAVLSSGLGRRAIPDRTPGSSSPNCLLCSRGGNGCRPDSRFHSSL